MRKRWRRRCRRRPSYQPEFPPGCTPACALLIVLSVAVPALADPDAGVPSDRASPDTARNGVPDDAELEAREARIGRITVVVGDIFEDVAQLSMPYRIVDRLHVDTRESTVFNQLLFRPGDTYSGRALEETARTLRARRYLKDASVVPIRYNDDDTVDVEVRVRDVWTTHPGVSFGRKGGANTTRVKFEDSNFLGFGKTVEISRGSDIERTAWKLAYRDPNVLGSRWSIAASRADLSDGEETVLALELPFYSFDAPFSIGFSGLDSTATVSRYTLGQVVDQFSMDRAAFEVHGGVSQGWRSGWVKRYLFGVRHDGRAFSPVAGELATAQLPSGRTLSYPWVGLELIEDDYRSLRNLNQIGRAEDVYLGRSLRLETGLSSGVLGADDNALVFAGSAQMGFELPNETYLTGAVEVSGRIQRGALRNSIIEIDTRYYRRQSPRRVLFAGLRVAAATRLDPEEQLLLGGDSGLRGYPLRYQAGTGRALLTLEQRFYTNWQPLKLFDVGAAVFFDTGRTWGRDAVAGEPLGWLQNVGIGLRLGSARSGRGKVLHVDLAWPLDRSSIDGAGIDRLQLLIETRASF